MVHASSTSFAFLLVTSLASTVTKGEEGFLKHARVLSRRNVSSSELLPSLKDNVVWNGAAIREKMKSASRQLADLENQHVSFIFIPAKEKGGVSQELVVQHDIDRLHETAGNESAKDMFKSPTQGNDNNVTGPHLQAQIGTWDPVIVTPYETAVGRLTLDGCTGTLVSSQLVITAASCVYNTQTDQFYAPQSFCPGLNNNVSPFGCIPVSQWQVASSYSASLLHTPVQDIAIGLLETKIRSAYWGYAAAAAAPLLFPTAIYGYPCDLPGYPGCGYMWMQPNCRMDQDISNDLVWTHTCDTQEPGYKGAPIVTTPPGCTAFYTPGCLPMLRGVHSGARLGVNEAAKLTPDIANDIAQKRLLHP